jgi:hypothetical protein
MGGGDGGSGVDWVAGAAVGGGAADAGGDEHPTAKASASTPPAAISRADGIVES